MTKAQLAAAMAAILIVGVTATIECDGESCRYDGVPMTSSNLTTVPDLEGVDPAVFHPDGEEEEWGEDEGRRKRNIFGHDTRFSLQLAKYSQVFPFSTVVHFSTGCTGTLISPLHVLTAATCFHDGSKYKKGFRKALVGRYDENLSDQGEGYAKRDPRSPVEDKMVWTTMDKVFIPRMWTRARAAPGAGAASAGRKPKNRVNAPGQNFAVVRLKEKLGRHAMELGLSPLDEDDPNRRRIHFSAFHFDIDTKIPRKIAKTMQLETSDRARLLYRWCKVERQHHQFLYHQCDAADGALGAGIYMSVWDERERRRTRKLVGIYTNRAAAPREGGARLGINQSVRLTPYKKAQICYFMTGDRASCYGGIVASAAAASSPSSRRLPLRRRFAHEHKRRPRVTNMMRGTHRQLPQAQRARFPNAGVLPQRRRPSGGTLPEARRPGTVPAAGGRPIGSNTRRPGAVRRPQLAARRPPASSGVRKLPARMPTGAGGGSKPAARRPLLRGAAAARRAGGAGFRGRPQMRRRRPGAAGAGAIPRRVPAPRMSSAAPSGGAPLKRN